MNDRRTQIVGRFCWLWGRSASERDRPGGTFRIGSSVPPMVHVEPARGRCTGTSGTPDTALKGQQEPSTANRVARGPIL